jgi:hypothetical protein
MGASALVPTRRDLGMGDTDLIPRAQDLIPTLKELGMGVPDLIPTLPPWFVLGTVNKHSHREP